MHLGLSLTCKQHFNSQKHFFIQILYQCSLTMVHVPSPEMTKVHPLPLLLPPLLRKYVLKYTILEISPFDVTTGTDASLIALPG